MAPKTDIGLVVGRFDLPYFRAGHGPVLALIQPLATAESESALKYELSFLKPLIERFTVYSINGRPGLPRGVTMADLANDYAKAIGANFREPIDIVGLSTGGSLALQFALDHPALVRRLVLVATGPRLSARGRDASARCAQLLEAGRPKAAQRALAGALTRNGAAEFLLGGMMWLAAAAMGVGKGESGRDMARVLNAEVGFDATHRMGELKMPALFVSGRKDACYDIEDVRDAAAETPDGTLLEENTGHIGVLSKKQRLWRHVGDFLAR